MINLVFDYDGTIHDPVRVFAPAFRDTFGKYIEEKHGCGELWPDSRIASWFGVSMEVMKADVAPFVTPGEMDRLIADMSENVRARMHSDEQTMFPGTEEVLRTLRQRGLHLILFSKCDRMHIDRQRRTLPLDDYFDDIFCTGDFGDMNEDKAVVFPELAKRFSGPFVIIGDRKQDIDMARRWGLPSVGCAYGYGAEGELEGASALAADISELPRLLDAIIKEAGW